MCSWVGLECNSVNALVGSDWIHQLGFPGAAAALLNKNNNAMFSYPEFIRIKWKVNINLLSFLNNIEEK